MVRLLISVRDAGEAKTALRSGADVIDVKEPLRGPLGAPDPRTVDEIGRIIGNKLPLSVALGELGDWDPAAWILFPRGVSFAKFGLAGCGRRHDWMQRWHKVLSDFPAGVRPVAVIYADWLAAAAPAPAQVLHAAVENRCGAVLIDTFDKSLGSLLDWFALPELKELVESIRQRQMQVALAGSLSMKTAAQILPLKPDYVAVRGAVCRGSRTGPVDAERVRLLAQLVARGNPRPFSEIA